jgi:hypothetical protein
MIEMVGRADDALARTKSGIYNGTYILAEVRKK